MSSWVVCVWLIYMHSIIWIKPILSLSVQQDIQEWLRSEQQKNRTVSEGAWTPEKVRSWTNTHTLLLTFCAPKLPDYLGISSCSILQVPILSSHNYSLKLFLKFLQASWLFASGNSKYSVFVVPRAVIIAVSVLRGLLLPSNQTNSSAEQHSAGITHVDGPS